MSDATSLLERIEIAKPCPAKWEDMTGDERTRRCALCKLDVYDVSTMRREEAEAFLANRTGRTCIRLWRRADGTVITRDCPVGIRAMWKRVAWTAAAVAGVLLTVASMIAPRGTLGTPRSSTPVTPGPERLMGEMAAPPARGATSIMGDYCLPVK